MTTIVVLAAGLGSRFGGNKQLAEFGQHQLTLMEYNLINAIDAGFNRVVFVIRPELANLLKQQVITRLPKGLSYDIVFQTLDDLPSGCDISEHRKKPLGTAHALWCCRDKVKDSFAVINADDFYGKQAFSLLLTQANKNPEHYSMVAYQLKNTLSDFGAVNRGLCQVSEQLYLLSIKECEQIQASEYGINGLLSTSKEHIKLTDTSLISMNCWFFTYDIFVALEKALIKLLTFKSQALTHENTECYLPDVVMQQIQKHNKKVHVLETNDSWFGLTYSQDSRQVNEKITALFKKR